MRHNLWRYVTTMATLENRWPRNKLQRENAKYPRVVNIKNSSYMVVGKAGGCVTSTLKYGALHTELVQ
jgi:hypothetical protein